MTEQNVTVTLIHAKEVAELWVRAVPAGRTDFPGALELLASTHPDAAAEGASLAGCRRTRGVHEAGTDWR